MNTFKIIVLLFTLCMVVMQINASFEAARKYERDARQNKDKGLHGLSGDAYEAAANIYRDLGKMDKAIKLYLQAAEEYTAFGWTSQATEMKEQAESLQ